MPIVESEGGRRVYLPPSREKKIVAKRLITAPAKAKFIQIREEYLAICNGDPCAAALLHWLERWASWRMEIGQDAWRGPLTRAEVSMELLGTFTVYRISRAISMLTKCGFIDVMQGVRHAYDRKQMLRINIDVVQEAIDAWFRIVEDADSQNAKCENEEWKMRNRIMEDADSHFAKHGFASSTLEDQSLDSESLNQVVDQKAAAEHARERAEAAAAADHITDEMRESFDQPPKDQPHPRPLSQGRGETNNPDFFKAGTIGAASTTPPSSAPPPLRGEAVTAYERNIGKAGEVVRKAIDEAAVKFGDAVVIQKIEQAARKGAKSWAYVEAMLTDVKRPAGERVAWGEKDDLPRVTVNAEYAGWDGKGSLWEFMRARHEMRPEETP